MRERALAQPRGATGWWETSHGLLDVAAMAMPDLSVCVQLLIGRGRPYQGCIAKGFRFLLNHPLSAIRHPLPPSCIFPPMKLYYSRGACSLAPHIILHEAGLQAELQKFDTRTRTLEGGGDFTRVNPNGYVPVLQLDDGQFLTEASVILQYLADLKPQSGLAPAQGTLARYRLMEWLSFVATELHKSFGPLFAPTTPEEYKATVRQKLAQRLGYVDQKLAGKQYLLGDTFTVADAYLFVIVNWSRAMHVDLTAFTNLQAFQQRVAQRPAVQAAMQAEGLVK